MFQASIFYINVILYDEFVNNLDPDLSSLDRYPALVHLNSVLDPDLLNLDRYPALVHFNSVLDPDSLNSESVFYLHFI